MLADVHNMCCRFAPPIQPKEQLKNEAVLVDELVVAEHTTCFQSVPTACTPALVQPATVPDARARSELRTIMQHLAAADFHGAPS